MLFPPLPVFHHCCDLLHAPHGEEEQAQPGPQEDPDGWEDGNGENDRQGKQTPTEKGVSIQFHGKDLSVLRVLLRNERKDTQDSISHPHIR